MTTPKTRKYVVEASIQLVVEATNRAHAESIAENTNLNTWTDFEITNTEVYE